MNNKVLIEFKNVTVGYGKKVVLSNLNFEIYQNDFIGIVGPNGAGKTTILRAILGILKPLKGKVIYHSKLKFGYVPQLQTINELFPLTVYEIVLMGRYSQIGIINRPKLTDKEKVFSVLKYFDIESIADKIWQELSGGLRQRVLLARALVADPDVLVLDEPVNDLDLTSEKLILGLIKKLHSEKNITIIMVSHFLNAVVNSVKKIAFITNKEFKIQDINSALTEQNFAKLYGIEVKIHSFENNKLIIAKDR